MRNPMGIISELKMTFIKRYIVQWANKAEIRQEERSRDSLLVRAPDS